MKDMLSHLYGFRTFVAALVAMGCLVFGLWLLKSEDRGDAYLAFGGSVVAALGALATKSTLTAAAGGDGLINAGKNILTDRKPTPPTPPGSPTP